jgi:hypothetical protein
VPVPVPVPVAMVNRALTALAVSGRPSPDSAGPERRSV